MKSLETCVLVRDAGPLWTKATTSRFLDALADGSLPAEAFNRWLAQDFHFADALTSFQAIALAKTPWKLRKPLLAGLTALGAEMDWFQTTAAARGVNLDAAVHPVCRHYCDFLIRVAYNESYPALFVVLFGVEASYLAAWSRLRAQGPYEEFIRRWSSPAFTEYVASLRALAEEHPQESHQAYFEDVLNHESDFWTMAWEG
jgi:formylaminopyrimidine deformylase / aminopyrimidine aminohydrolase